MPNANPHPNPDQNPNPNHNPKWRDSSKLSKQWVTKIFNSLIRSSANPGPPNYRFVNIRFKKHLFRLIDPVILEWMHECRRTNVKLCFREVMNLGADSLSGSYHVLCQSCAKNATTVKRPRLGTAAGIFWRKVLFWHACQLSMPSKHAN